MVRNTIYHYIGRVQSNRRWVEADDGVLGRRDRRSSDYPKSSKEVTAMVVKKSIST